MMGRVIRDSLIPSCQPVVGKVVYLAPTEVAYFHGGNTVLFLFSIMLAVFSSCKSLASLIRKLESQWSERKLLHLHKKISHA